MGGLLPSFLKFSDPLVALCAWATKSITWFTPWPQTIPFYNHWCHRCTWFGSQRWETFAAKGKQGETKIFAQGWPGFILICSSIRVSLDRIGPIFGILRATERAHPSFCSSQQEQAESKYPPGSGFGRVRVRIVRVFRVRVRVPSTRSSLLYMVQIWALKVLSGSHRKSPNVGLF